MSDQLERMMQEQLDGVLDTEAAELLFQNLDEDTQAAGQYERLETVDMALKRAPMARAPQHLAAVIMARLSEQVEAQAEIQELPEELRQAIMMSISTVTMSMMPVMVAASWLVLNAHRNPVLLRHTIERVVLLQVLMIDALLVVLDEMERVVNEAPDMAPVAMSLLPVLMEGMMSYIDGNGVQRAAS
ncbi:MAG: hypothetical protein ACPG7F_04980 [Aggregatilineales bacterium]